MKSSPGPGNGRPCHSPGAYSPGSRLRSGLTGVDLQKFVNYGGRIAIYGDFTKYTRKPLHGFIYESSQGPTLFFAPTLEEAIGLMTGAVHETNIPRRSRGIFHFAVLLFCLFFCRGRRRRIGILPELALEL